MYYFVMLMVAIYAITFTFFVTFFELLIENFQIFVFLLIINFKHFIIICKGFVNTFFISFRYLLLLLIFEETLILHLKLNNLLFFLYCLIYPYNYHHQYLHFKCNHYYYHYHPYHHHYHHHHRLHHINSIFME